MQSTAREPIGKHRKPAWKRRPNNSKPKEKR